jgi:hypothetical protein
MTTYRVYYTPVSSPLSNLYFGYVATCQDLTKAPYKNKYGQAQDLPPYIWSIPVGATLVVALLS